jgi:hypothetical protein
VGQSEVLGSLRQARLRRAPLASTDAIRGIECLCSGQPASGIWCGIRRS